MKQDHVTPREIRASTLTAGRSDDEIDRYSYG